MPGGNDAELDGTLIKAQGVQTTNTKGTTGTKNTNNWLVFVSFGTFAAFVFRFSTPKTR